MRLDRFLSNLAQYNRQTARQLLVSGHVQVDGVVVCEGLCNVSQFSRIEVDNQLLQAGKPARYFMLHKPIGVVSATEHDEHRTVLDLLDEPDKADLHLAGRLDLNTSGLLLITNDGQWSRRLTEPRSLLGKVYRVTTEQPISAEYIEVFAQGLYFAYEGLTTLPAELVILDSHSALLTLHEGRYHQVKRMFGHFQNKVIDLHRLSMGSIELDPQLAPGQYRALNSAEIASC
ncbi:16S rRNA pseudouridine(516) synthase [Pseudomonas sp. TMP9]|uniref:pseudouridine synthase n=1 Tax=Pseudomonas sp. TMP9 TaxID=3133144 RepID=UPI0030D09C7F